MKFAIACCSIVLGGCTTLGSIVPHGGSGGSSGGASLGGVASASGLTSKQSSWRKLQEDSANAKGDWDDGRGDDGHMKRSHEHVAQNCGHDIQVVFDWNTIDMNHWLEIQKKQNRRDDLVAGFCTYETVYELGSACADDSPLKSYQRDAIKQIKTLTCHYRPCKDMPDVGEGEHGRQDVMTYSIYAVSNGGTNLDMTFCESATNGSMVVNKWMRSL